MTFLYLIVILFMMQLLKEKDDRLQERYYDVSISILLKDLEGRDDRKCVLTCVDL